jgi:integrase/transposase
MSIRPRQWRNKDGSLSERWVYDYVDNSSKRRHRTFRRKREAEAARQKIEAELAGGIHTASRASVTVQQSSELWYTACEARNPPFERTTLDAYKREKDQINAELGAEKLNQLTTAKVIAFRDKIAIQAKERGNTGDKAGRLVQILRVILADSQERGLVAQNVAAQLRKKKDSGRFKPKLEAGIDIPEPGEIRRLIAQLNDPRFVRWRAMLLTFIFTGLRASELRGLPKNNVDLDKGELHVRQRADAYKKIGATKTRGSRRTVPLIPTLVSVLREHILSVPKTDHNLVFPTRYGAVYDDSTITDTGLKPLQVAAGIVNDKGKGKYSLHKLRHFYASWCINRKIDGGLEWPIKTVSERLGHASIRMTSDTYGHLFPRGDDRAELAAADAMFFDNVPAPRPATATVTMLKPVVDNIVPVEDITPTTPQPVLEPVGEPAAVDDERVPAVGSASPRERAEAAILAFPDLDDPSLATKIGVSPQTIRRAREGFNNNKNQPSEVQVADEPTPRPMPDHPKALEFERARAAATVSVEGRSALGQFLPGPRPTSAKMARIEAAVLANPGMSTRALANELGVLKSSVKYARKRLKDKRGEEVLVDGRSRLGQFLPGARITPQGERAKAAVLANPQMPIRTLAKKLGLPRTTLRRVQKELTALGRLTPSPRPPLLMDRARAALLQNKGMTASAIARMIGASKKTVLNAKRGLNENALSGAVPTEGTTKAEADAITSGRA